MGIHRRQFSAALKAKIAVERGIAWRCADSVSLKQFLGFELAESTPDHSTMSRTRRLIDVETHSRIFKWMLQVLAKHGLVSGKTVGVDATTLEANAALFGATRARVTTSF